MQSRRGFQGNIDALFVLSWNQDLNTFSSLVEAAALDVHAYIALVNNREFGDSRVRVPRVESYRRDLCRLKGGLNDHLVVVDIDVHTLRQFQSRATRKPTDDYPFKVVPEDFVIAPYRFETPRGGGPG
jgi:hypothetical protein